MWGSRAVRANGLVGERCSRMLFRAGQTRNYNGVITPLGFHAAQSRGAEPHQNCPTQPPQSRSTRRMRLAKPDLDTTWQEFSNCLGVDPDLFFPERGASTREAKEVCRGCVVREDCLEFALQNGEKFGIWGGMSERERRRIRRQRALARAAAASAEPVVLSQSN